MQIRPRYLKLWWFLYFINENLNKNAKVEKLTKKLGRSVRLIVIVPLTLILIWTLLPNLTFYLIARGFHRTFATGAACQQMTLIPPDTLPCPICDLRMFSCWDHWHSIIHNASLWHLFLIWLFPDFDVITEYRFPKGICNGCDMPTGDAYSSRHLVLSHFGTCKYYNVETNLSSTCLVSGLLSFGHPSVQVCF